MTAQDPFNDLHKLPTGGGEAFFLLVGQQAFRDENFSHDEVFGHLADAEYLEVSMATFRRFVRDGKLTPHAEVERSQLFAVAALKAFKRQRKAIKG